MKKFKLEFNEKVEEKLGNVDMKNIAGGHETDTEFFGSRLFCATNIPGDCLKSKSCSGAWICLPGPF